MSPVGGGRVKPRVHRRETMSSEVLEMLRVWLLRRDQASTLSNSAWIEAVLEAGTTKVASSAYLEKAFPGVTALRSDVHIMNIWGPRAEPCTTLELIDNADDTWLANLVK